MRVELLRSGSDAPLHGLVRTIEPGGFTKVSALGVEEQRVWVIIGLSSPHADWARLGDAYRVNARFVLRAADGVLVLPASALFRHDQVDAVFRVDGRRVARVPVQVGLRGGGLVEIRGGLAAGERVVVHPDRSLQDGARVRLR
jgi:HlyD family secretion protein